MKYSCILLLVIMFNLSFAYANDNNCSIYFKKIGLCANIVFKIFPNKKKSSDFELSFYKKSNGEKVLPSAKVLTYLWMEMPGLEGHGSDPISLKKIDNKYLAENVWFLMEGHWQLHIQLRDKNSIIDQGNKVYCIEGRKIKCN